MFGFIRPKNRDLKTAQPAAKPSGILVTKEDIYRENKGMEPILLLRKGYEVTTEELPRFIRNGAKPHQFQFKHTDAPLAAPAKQTPLKLPPQPVPSPAQHRRIAPMPVMPPGPPTQRTSGRSKKALILDADPKSMKRLIDCLFICGIQLDRIHPVRVPEQLRWAAEKYRPHIVVVDYDLLPGDPQTGLDIILAISHLPWLERSILTVNAQPFLSEAEQQTIETLCREKNIKILVKPVNRFTLNQVLND